MKSPRNLHISDDVWARIAPLMPQPRRDPARRYRRRPGSGRKPLPSRRIFEAIVYVLRTGTPWKSLPRTLFGSPSAIHRYFREWHDAGLFAEIWRRGLAQHPDFEGIAWKWHDAGSAGAGNRRSGGPSPRRRGDPRRRWGPARQDAPHDAAADGEAPVPTLDSRGKWSATCQRLRLDILRGSYGRGIPLPPRKVLVHRYGVSYPTLRKCLDLLEGDALVMPYKRGYLVPTFGPGSPGSRLTLLWHGSPRDEKTGGAPFDELEEMFIRFLESESLRAGIILETISCYPGEDGSIHFYRRESLQPCELRDDADVRGYVVLVIAPSDVAPGIIAMLKSFEKPVAVVDQIGDPVMYETARRSPGFRVFTTRGGMRPGRDVGRYLLSLGHRRIAYLSPYHDDVWSRLRFQGIVREYARAGIPDGVRACVNAEKMHDPDAGGAWIPMREGARHFGLPQLMASFDQWLEGVPRGLARKVNAYFRTWVGVVCGVEEACSALRPLMDETLTDKSITAWVASGDAVAQFVLDFLVGRKVGVPQDLSLISFDNTIKALRQGITSYSFGEPALAAAVLNHILRPAETGEIQRRNIVQIPGIVVERSTTARVSETA